MNFLAKGPPIIARLITFLMEQPGVQGCVLGGSRATKTHSEYSDYDIGLYYRQGFVPQELAIGVSQIIGAQVHFSSVYEWGPRVNGGAWLKYDDYDIDIIYRDLDMVQEEYENAQAGRIKFHYQLGHPLGVPGYAYVGELALSIPLMLNEELANLNEKVHEYPDALAHSLIFHGLFDARFSLSIARKAIAIRDYTYISGCLFVAIELAAHALHGYNHRWLINEKRALISAARLPQTLPLLEERFLSTLIHGDDTQELLAYKLDQADKIIDHIMDLVGYTGPRNI